MSQTATHWRRRRRFEARPQGRERVSNYGGYLRFGGRRRQRRLWDRGATGAVTNYGVTSSRRILGSRRLWELASAAGNVINYAVTSRRSGDSGRGVAGIASGTARLGVLGEAAVSGTTYWRGKVNSPNGYGGYFEAAGYFSGNVASLATASGNPGSGLTRGRERRPTCCLSGTSGSGRERAHRAVTQLWRLLRDSRPRAMPASRTDRNAAPRAIGVYGNLRAPPGRRDGQLWWLPSAAGNLGRGVQGTASATGRSCDTTMAVYFKAAGNNGRGVVGLRPPRVLEWLTLGGRFEAEGGSGTGVYAVGDSLTIFTPPGPAPTTAPLPARMRSSSPPAFRTSPKPGLIVVTAGPAKVRHDETGAGFDFLHPADGPPGRPPQ